MYSNGKNHAVFIVGVSWVFLLAGIIGAASIWGLYGRVPASEYTPIFPLSQKELQAQKIQKEFELSMNRSNPGAIRQAQKVFNPVAVLSGAAVLVSGATWFSMLNLIVVIFRRQQPLPGARQAKPLTSTP